MAQQPTQHSPRRSGAARIGIVIFILIILAAVILGGLIAWRSHQRANAPVDTALLDQITQYGANDGSKEADPIKRGLYLAQAGDCIACHTAKGGKPFAGGLGLNTPFGVIVSSNITPDKRYGIGDWTDAQFLHAVKDGVAPHGKLLYPAMPYNLYSRVTDKDLLDVFAYLKTVAPVAEAPPANQLPFPFNIRQSLFFWNLLFFNPTPFTPDPKQSIEWNRGAYLVDGLGHCTACHSGKNFLGGDTDYLQGYDLEGWHAPEITGNTYTGIGSWSNADVVAYLHTGGNRISVAAGSMGEAVTNSTQHMTEGDLSAIATYLKSLPGSDRKRPTPLQQTDAMMVLGHDIYQSNCAACHKTSGEGVEAMVPSLANNPGVQAPGANNVIRTILMGGRGAATASNPTSAEMPAFAWKLSDQEVAAVATYIRNSWGNAADAITAADATKLRTRLKAPPQLGSQP
ncbi:alcohol dehydrogenase [Robbsia andropogonis]|uniref:Alcohol dehydrogenase n=1 Tax=Robbsia andropogonis TaxID=28092 RepID=A0A0F5K2R6_9BURK|nr:cytochrome c [Robbsia andropogonis]KKB64154.1 alcohol dehydrogenase [Robbsia andropogonis]MCP1119654.1 cytochrome c [Robbsia andropogonis]MCP1129637.1 cytochrome c [Robbsia andropogonis]